MTLQQRLEEATADLSRCQVASDVAEILRVEGVQGQRGNCSRCPVAALLLKRLGPGVSIHVDEGKLSATLFGAMYAATVPCPAAVEAFITEFDGEPAYDPTEDSEMCYPNGGWDEFAVTSP